MGGAAGLLVVCLCNCRLAIRQSEAHPGVPAARNRENENSGSLGGTRERLRQTGQTAEVSRRPLFVGERVAFSAIRSGFRVAPVDWLPLNNVRFGPSRPGCSHPPVANKIAWRYKSSMRQYLDLLQHILDRGTSKADRTGTGTLSVFGHQARYDLSAGFPLMTTKKLHLKSIVHELLWFLQGDTNISYLKENGVSIWDEWADAAGDLGPVYGAQWRSWPTADGGSIDQIGEVLRLIKEDPDSRRMIVSAWNVSELPKMALPPCHLLFQFYVADGRLSSQLYQRSADVFLGVPFNIASYALLTMMVAQVSGLQPGEFIHTLGDAHLYANHLEQTRLQLKRKPRNLPTLEINPQVKSLFDFQYEDFQLKDYDPHPHIRAPVAV